MVPCFLLIVLCTWGNDAGPQQVRPRSARALCLARTRAQHGPHSGAIHGSEAQCGHHDRDTPCTPPHGASRADTDLSAPHPLHRAGAFWPCAQQSRKAEPKMVENANGDVTPAPTDDGKVREIRKRVKATTD